MVDLAERIAALSPEQRELLQRRLKETNAAGSDAKPALSRRYAKSSVLSFSQQRLWFLDQFEPGGSLYNVPSALRLTGALDVAALEQSVHSIIVRHEVLRTTFSLVDGEPVQIIQQPTEQRLEIVDLSALEEDKRRSEAERLVQEEALLPFDLQRGPVFRASLLRMRQNEHILLLIQHHIVSDGWSQGVMRKELSALYNAFSQGKPNPLPELSLQYADYAAWQRAWLQGQILENQIGYWKKNLLGAPALLELPTDRPRPAEQSFNGALKRLELTQELTLGINLLTQREGATQFMTLLAAFQVLLSRYSGQEDIVVGTPIANRTNSETEQLIGLFLNTLALRSRLSGDPTFREFLSQVRSTALRAYAHQDLPFERLVEELQPERSMSHSPLFQVMFTLQNTAGGLMELRGLRVERAGSDSVTAKFDLTFGLSESDDRLRGWIEYNTDLFDDERIERMLVHYQTLLEGIVTNPDKHISRLSILTQPERDQLLVEWNDTACEYPRDRCVHQLFEEQVRRTPDSTALVFDGEELSYSQLNARANQLARFLRQEGVGPNSLAAVCLERSIDMVVALLAILKAGGAYVAVDPVYPVDRIRYTLQDASASVILTHQALLDQLPITDAVTVCLDRDAAQISMHPTGDLPCSTQPSDLAYVLYTSGSTGRPKGVAIEHRSPVALVSWALGQLTAQELSGVVFATSICFDLSVYELFVTLCGGGRVLLVENALAIASLGDELRPSLINTVPSAMAELLRQGAVPSSVVRVNLAGEPLTGDLVDAIYDQTGVLKVYDLYGPSEDTTYSTYALRERKGPLTIGRPISNTQAYVLDRNLCPVPVGVPGELYLGGDGLARGYLNRGDLTAERFMPDPFSSQPGRRLYRTGDLVRYRSDANLEYLGRMDHQVKIRGFRIELGEIECALVGVTGVREAAVLAREDVPGDKRLVAYISSAESTLSTSLVREHLSDKLPAYMIPALFVFLESLPLSPNGKINRKALPAPDANAFQENAYVAPRNPVEEGLAEIWATVLNTERVGVHDNFFALGGHSLLATQVISRIRSTFKVELPLRTIFEAPNVAGLAERIEGALGEENATAPPLERASREQPIPLSFAQQRLWFLDQFEPGSSLYNIPLALNLAGTLNRDAIQQSLNEMVCRHESLRTTFSIIDGDLDSDPIQIIHEPSDCSLEFVDLSCLEDVQREQESQRLVQEESQRPFDLQQGPLFRARLLRLGDEEHILLLTGHHIISDGWSQGILGKELSTLYNAFSQGKPCSLPALPIQYADYAVWQRNWLQGEALERQIGYWKQNLSGAPTLLELPTDRPRPPAQTFRGASKRLTFPESLSQPLQQLGQREGATMYMTLLAAFQVLLSRYSGQDDIVVGTPIANRTQSDTEGVIGFFTNTLALRGDLSGDPSFKELLSRTRESALGAYVHQDLPFEKLVEELQPERSMSHSPVFQVSFILQNSIGGAMTFDGLQLAGAGREGVTSKFDLTLGLSIRSGALYGVMEYNTDLFDEDRIERMMGQYQTLLESIIANPDERVSRLSLLTQTERVQLIKEWNDTNCAYPAEKCAHILFEEQAARTPEATAVVFDGKTLTYSQMNERANQLARYLQKHGVGPDVLVGLCIERSLEMVVGILGILKAGGAYVPLDPSYPPERLAFMLNDARPVLLLTTLALRNKEGNSVLPTLCLDSEWDQVASEGTQNPCSDAAPDNLAYVIYTSGSTGRPKGALVSHSNLVHSTTARWRYYRDKVTSFLLLSSVAFDSSVAGIFWTLTQGGSLILPAGSIDIHDLCELVKSNQVSHLLAIPSLYSAILQESPSGDLASLQTVIVAGEACPPNLLLEHRKQIAHASLFNEYGPTEASVWCIVYNCDSHAPGAPVPIGRPIANTQIYLLDGHLQTVPIGVPGEVYVGGDGITRGYLGQPELTADKFIADPFSLIPGGRLYKTGDLARFLADGNIEYLGRVDHQVKIRGFRIELGEIEDALLKHPDVQEAVVLARHDAPGDRRLVAYIGSAVSSLNSNLLREHLLDKLPGYMIPAAFVFLGALPSTPNGKVDRKALPSPDLSGLQEDTYVAPRNPIEEGLAEIWGAVLRVELVGIFDNFFELGGHSLLATQVISRIRNTFQIELPLRALFESTTIERLAKRIAGSSEEEGREVPLLVPIPREGRLPLSFAQQRLWFIDQIDPQSSLYNIPTALRINGSLNVNALHQSLDTIVARHEVLRTTFAFGDGEPYQVIGEPVTCDLECADLSSIGDNDREQEAQRLIQEEMQRPFDLQKGPLFRTRLLRLGDEEHVLLLTVHHIVSDGWSQGILKRELFTLYNAIVDGRPSSLPELPIQYADYAAWQRAWVQGKVTETQLSYWRAQLNSAHFGLPIRADRMDSPDPTFNPGIQHFLYSAEDANSIEEVARQERASLFIVLLAAFCLLLYQDSRQEDICVGTPVSGRRWTETEDLIGLFLNTLVIRSNLSGNPSFRELIGRVRNTVLAAHAHQDLPFEQVVDAVKPQRDLSHTPLFRVWFTFGESSPPVAECTGLSMRSVSAVLPLARYALRMNVSRFSGGLRGQLIYQTDIFDDATIERLARKMEMLLSVVACDADLHVTDIADRLSEIDRLSRLKQEQQLDESNRMLIPGRRTRTVTQV